MTRDRVYMDHAATTAVAPEVLEAMLPYFTERYGNPSSIHRAGRDARRAMDRAREQVAAAIHARPEEIYFTSGGSESDNWALRSVLHSTQRPEILTTRIEHHAVINTCAHLAEHGVTVGYIPVDHEGTVLLADFGRMMTENTTLVSVMAANNEVGTLEPIAAIGEMARSKGVLFHTDAVQAIGNIPVDVRQMNIDMLSLSAHKFNGPKGVGALYIRKGVKPEPFIYGGAQERNRRAGTENLPGIVGLGAAIERAVSNMERNRVHVTAMRDRLTRGLLERIPDSGLNGPRENRLPGNVNISIPGIERESLILRLDMAGIEISGGSACSAGSLEPSHVLLAMGIPFAQAFESVRLTLGPDNTDDEVDWVLEVFPEIVRELRK